MKVLVLDDIAAVRRVIAENLRQRGFEVVSTETINAAHTALALHPDIRVILSDVDLGPGQYGVDFYGEVLPRVTSGALGFAFMSGGMEDWLETEVRDTVLSTFCV